MKKFYEIPTLTIDSNSQCFLMYSVEQDDHILFTDDFSVDGL